MLTIMLLYLVPYVDDLFIMVNFLTTIGEYMRPTLPVHFHQSN